MTPSRSMTVTITPAQPTVRAETATVCSRAIALPRRPAVRSAIRASIGAHVLIRTRRQDDAQEYMFDYTAKVPRSGAVVKISARAGRFFAGGAACHMQWGPEPER